MNAALSNASKHTYQLVKLGIVLFLIFLFIKMMPKVTEWLKGLSNMFTGGGNRASQEQVEVSETQFQRMKKVAEQKGLLPGSALILEANSLKSVNNTYSGIFDSYADRILDKEDQVKGKNIIMKGKSLTNLDYKRLASLIIAYGTPALPNRQTPVIGYFIEDTRGTLPEHIERYYSGDIKIQLTSAMNAVVKHFLT